jgi:hypothetical protein
VNVCYSDGSCWEESPGCKGLEPAGWMPVLARTLHAAQHRALEGHCRMVCLTIWFADRSCMQVSLPPQAPAEARQAEGISACKQDITRVLHENGIRLTGSKILEELAARNLHWGDSTVKRALAQMRRDGELTYRTGVSPRGYGLPAWG